MKRSLPVVLAAMLLCAGSAHASWREALSPSRNWQRLCHVTGRACDAVSGYCHNKVEKARADQAKNWGLKLPASFDAARPLAVLIHGLDSDQGVWCDLKKLVEAQGVQVGYFNYPSDGPIEQAGATLATDMQALHERWPAARVYFVSHSMGALVARDYLEGARYVHPVERFIAIGPPNHGSTLAGYRWMLELHEHYELWRTHKDWSPLWALTDGHGEAGDELRPASKFLQELNSRPRREGVQYTIIAGTQHYCWRKTADSVGWFEDHVLPQKDWWGLRHARGGMDCLQCYLRGQCGQGDGAVSETSARLEGVSDVVTVPADHNALMLSINAAPPAAWEAVRDRLR